MKKVRLLALLAALATAVLLFFFFNSLGQTAELPKTGVYVAAERIPANVPITELMLAVMELPDEAILPDAVKDLESIVGKVARSEILVGEQVLGTKLVAPGEAQSASTLDYSIEPGMRAITIAIDSVAGLAYMLAPGNHVDILSQFQIEMEINGETETQQVGTLLMENIPILAVDYVMAEGGKTGQAEKTYTTLTLQVTPAQALDLSFSEYVGGLRAILRSPLDEGTNDLPNITIEDVL